jgi:hypothetical protein
MLIAEATLRLIPNLPDDLRLQASRAFAHREMKEASEKFANNAVMNNQYAKNLLHLLAPPLNPLIRSVAATFVTLQELRHSADYNLIESFGRLRVLQIINQARQAMADWAQVRDTEQARVFLTALLLHDRWGRTNY